MRQPLRMRHKGCDRDTNQKQLSETDKRFYYTADDDTTVQLASYQQEVIITNNHAFVLALPPVAEVKSIQYKVTVANSGSAVTLTDYPDSTFGDSVSWPGDYTLDTAGDNITMVSSGKSWTVVSNNIV